jgi:hypothetical protein
VDAQLPLESPELFEGARELEAHHEVAMDGEALPKLGMDSQEFEQGSHTGSFGRLATNRSIRQRRSSPLSKRSAST